MAVLEERMTICGENGSGLPLGSFPVLGTVIVLNAKASCYTGLILTDQNFFSPSLPQKSEK